MTSTFSDCYEDLTVLESSIFLRQRARFNFKLACLRDQTFQIRVAIHLS